MPDDKAQNNAKDKKAQKALEVLQGVDKNGGLISLLGVRYSMLDRAKDHDFLDEKSKKIILKEITKTLTLTSSASAVINSEWESRNYNSVKKDWEKQYKDLQTEVDKHSNDLLNFMETLSDKPQTKSLIERFSGFWKACAKLIASAFTSPKIDLSEIDKQNKSLQPALDAYVAANSFDPFPDPPIEVDMNTDFSSLSIDRSSSTSPTVNMKNNNNRPNSSTTANLADIVKSVHSNNLVQPSSQNAAPGVSPTRNYEQKRKTPTR